MKIYYTSKMVISFSNCLKDAGIRGERQALEVWQKFSIQYVSKLAETAPNTFEKVAARYFKYFRNRMAMQERERERQTRCLLFDKMSTD